MLCTLDIRNVVLIDQLSIEFRQGLCALTGETGAGKSILLDSLGLALGTRADSSLVRKGADRAVVSASFQIDSPHAVLEALDDAGIIVEEGAVILRRVLSAEGKSRAYINDQPVSVAFLKDIGGRLVEIHGQFETQALFHAPAHRAMLDEYAGLSHDLSARWQCWHEAQDKLEDLKRGANASKEEEAYVRSCVDELDRWEPSAGEEEQLGALRSRLMHREQVLEALNTAYATLNGEGDPLQQAYAVLARVEDKAGEEMAPALEALDRAMAEAQEAAHAIEKLSVDLEESENDLEAIDERLFGLRGVARKHGCRVDDLQKLRDELAERLNGIENSDEVIEKQKADVVEAREAYLKAAQKVSTTRKETAHKLDTLVQAELAPLRLDKAQFVTSITALPEADWGPEGFEKVQFLVSTNPGREPGPIQKIASGGELSRFMLALKVVMAQVGASTSVIFDEVDAGTGGSVSDAVGERLARLARDGGKQVLVVTHAPQVAARANNHWIVQKTGEKDVKTTITYLETRGKRCEEIARMLAGATITREARAAADKLLENAA